MFRHVPGGVPPLVTKIRKNHTANRVKLPHSEMDSTHHAHQSPDSEGLEFSGPSAHKCKCSVTSFARDEEMGHVFSLPQTIMLPFSSARVGRRPRGALGSLSQETARASLASSTSPCAQQPCRRQHRLRSSECDTAIQVCLGERRCRIDLHLLAVIVANHAGFANCVNLQFSTRSASPKPSTN